MKNPKVNKEALTFRWFRKLILSRYATRLDKKPELKALIADLDYEGSTPALVELMSTYQDVQDVLDEFDNFDEFVKELDENYMHDYFIAVGI